MNYFLKGTSNISNLVPLGESSINNSIRSKNGKLEIFYNDEWKESLSTIIPQTIFVSKNGDDNNDGLRPNNPVLTLQKAYTLISELWCICILGYGIFDATGVIPTRCKLYGPNATITGEIKLSSCSVISVDRIMASANNTTIIKNLGCTGRTIINANIVSCSVDDTYIGTKFIQNQIENASIYLDINMLYLSESGHFISPVEAEEPINVLTYDTNITGDFGAGGTLTNILETSPITSYVSWSSRLGIYGYLTFDYGRQVTISEIMLSTRAADQGIGTFDVRLSNVSNFSTYIDKEHTFKTIPATNWEPYVFKTSYIVEPESARYMRIVLKTTSMNLQRSVSFNMIKTISYDEAFGGSIDIHINKIITNNNSTIITTRSLECNITGNINSIKKKNDTITGTKIIDIQNGSVKLSGLEIESDIYYILNGCDLLLNYGIYSGTETHTLGTLKKATYNSITI